MLKKRIKVYHPEKEKIRFIKDNRRVCIHLHTGKMIEGRYQVINADSILIEEQRFALNDIQSMKRHSFMFSFFINGVLYVSAGYIANVTWLVALIGQTLTPFLIGPPIVTALIYGGVRSPNFFRKYNTKKQWRLEIVIPSQ